VPTQPSLDGLPAWLQILISLVIGVATLGVAFKGYFIRDKPDLQPADKATASIQAAVFQDLGTMRHLADVCIILSGNIERLCKAVDENTHHKRNSIEAERDLREGLRELKDMISRLKP
jgi:hypothetical protein